MSGFEYLDHTADVALRGFGKTVEEAFCAAARGLFALMVDLEAVDALESISVSVRSETLEILLVEWLSRLLAEKDLLGLVLSRFSVKIDRHGGGVSLSGSGWGERLDPRRHGAKLEVKGVTYAGLRVWEQEGQWIAQCVVDT